MEVWKDIAGYEGWYEVSNMGNVRNVKRGRLLTPTMAGYYLRVCLPPRGTKKIYAHRLVAEAFIPNELNKPCVNHIDGNKENNRADNLEWVTFSENSRHAYHILKKWSTVGSASPCATFTDSDVLEIRKLLDSGEKTIKEVAEMFGAKHNTIYQIHIRRNWKHI